MSNESPLPSSDERLFSLGDLWIILKRSKRKIWIGGLIGLLLALIFAFYQPVVYRVQATFREKGKNKSAMERAGFTFGSLIGSIGEHNDSEAVTTLKSRKLIERLIVQHHLQGKIEPREGRLKRAFDQISNHLKAEVAWWTDNQFPVLADRRYPLRLEKISYKGEVPVGLELTLVDDDHFRLRDRFGELAGVGAFGKPIRLKNGIEFTVVRHLEIPLADQPYDIAILPLTHTAKTIARQIFVEIDKKDRTLLLLDYANIDRHQAAYTLNALMDLYQEYLKSENQRVMDEQINYLQVRQEELSDSLKEMMQEYAQKLSYDFANMGAINLEQAVEFLADTQRRYRQRLLQIELEIKRLQKASSEDIVHYDSESPGDAEIINRLLSQIRELRHQYDIIDVALSHTANQPTEEDQRQLFAHSINELQRLRNSIREVEEATLAMGEGREIPVGPYLQNSNYMVQNWYDRLQEAREAIKSAQAQPELQLAKDHFESLQQGLKSYLVNLMHFFRVQESALEESLAHQQHPQARFQGINLQIAQELYITYSRELNDVDAQILQLRHILEQINNATFEVSSLSAVLTDGVSRDLIARGGQLVLSLQDEGNRSLREQERVREELRQYKRFLSNHIEQTIDLFQLRGGLLQDKLIALQNTNLALIRQQISIAEKQLHEYVVSRLENLRQEKAIIHRQQEGLQQEMNSLPDHWVAEQLVNQRLEMSREMGKEITNLVESKNIMSNLERIQSAPFDPALVPIHPAPSRLVILAIMGALLGLGATMGGLLLYSVISALPATVANLRLSKLIAYPLPLSKSNKGAERESLRYVTQHAAKLPSKGEGARLLVFAEGNGPHLAVELATLLAKTGQRVLLLPLVFEGDTPVKGSLIDYLEGNTDRLNIEKGMLYDRLPAGCATDYCAELIHSSRWNKLLGDLKSSYDLILAASHAPLASVEILALWPRAHLLTAIVTHETLQELDPLLQATANDRDRMLFLVGEE